MMKKWDLKRSLSKETVWLVLMTELVLLAVGFRPVDVGTDTQAYLLNYMQHGAGYEILYRWIASAMSGLAIPPAYFLLCFAFMNLTLIFVLVRRVAVLTHQHIELYAMFYLVGLFLLLSRFFFSAMVNVLRHGTAILALFLFYVALVSGEPLPTGQLKLSVKAIICAAPFAIIALGFHRTSVIAIVFAPMLFLRYRTLLYSTAIVAFLYLTGLSEKLVYTLSGLTSLDIYSKIYNYGRGVYKTGVRWDFALFTLSVGVLFDWLSRYYLTQDDRAIFTRLMKVYWVFVLPFFLLGFGKYSDRYLLCGWLFISILCAVFTSFFSKTYHQSIKGLLNSYAPVVRLSGCFFIAALYFILKAQGFLV